jgi:hypothetical protein
MKSYRGNPLPDSDQKLEEVCIGFGPALKTPSDLPPIERRSLIRIYNLPNE